MEWYNSEAVLDARVLIIDDEAPNVMLLERVLAHGGFTNVISTRDSRETLELLRTFAPDVVLLDLHMPHVDGYEVLRQMQLDADRDQLLPVLVLTADMTQDAKERALSGGAKDFLAKPFDPTEVLLRVKILLETRQLHLRFRDQNTSLGAKVLEKTKDLEAAAYEIVHRLARAAEFRDDQTGQHTSRVGKLAGQVGQALGLALRDVELLRHAAPLHDIGKIGISDLILLKPGKLTAREFDTMKQHTTIGGNILAGSHFPLLQLAEQIARSHHERWDGSGYCEGLSGEQIPLVGRIVAVVDVFDALVHERPYKAAWNTAEALQEIRAVSKRQFDPEVVDAFLQIATQFDISSND